jgi:2'-5' RNA ligase
MRTFIALELPERVRKEIFKEFENLKNLGLASGNFVERDNFHLTLKFLGDISEETIVKIKEKLSEVDFSKFEMTTGKIGFFPSEKYIKVIWIELISNQLKFIKDIVDEKLSEIGINKDEREFSSHVTVARIKAIKDKDKFLEKIKELKIKKLKFEIDKICLIKSELMREGPVYKTLEEFKLH